MKVLYHGQEIEINSEIEEGEKELDKLTKNNNSLLDSGIDLEDTIEVTEDMLNIINNKGENYEQ